MLWGKNMQVVCISETARVDGAFSWLDFANTSGRLDVITRCAQMVLRERAFLPILTRVTLLLSNSTPQKILELNLRAPILKEEISEHKIALDLKELFTNKESKNKKSRFFKLQNGTLEDYLEQQKIPDPVVNNTGRDELLILQEEGNPFQGFKGNLFSSTVIIGDQNGFSEKTVEIVKKYQGKPISLGKNSYLSSHSLFLILYETLKRTKQKVQT